MHYCLLQEPAILRRKKYVACTSLKILWNYRWTFVLYMNLFAIYVQNNLSRHLCKYCCIYNKEMLSYHLMSLFLSLCFIIIVIIIIAIIMMVVVLLKHHLLKSEWGAAHIRVVFFRVAFINSSSFLVSFSSEYIWLLNKGPILKGIKASVSTDDHVYAVGSDSKGPDLRPVSLRAGAGMSPRDRNTGSKSTVGRPAAPGSGTGPTSKLASFSVSYLRQVSLDATLNLKTFIIFHFHAFIIIIKKKYPNPFVGGISSPIVREHFTAQ